jgi:hypothetical protein
MKDTKWMERYDYSSPEGLYQTTKQAMEAELEAQHGIVQFISKFDKTGIMAKRPQLMILGQTNAHIRMLEKQGNTSAEEIKELKDLAAQYKEQHGLGGPLMGLVSNGWGLTDVINDTLGDKLFAGKEPYQRPETFTTPDKPSNVSDDAVYIPPSAGTTYANPNSGWVEPSSSSGSSSKPVYKPSDNISTPTANPHERNIPSSSSSSSSSNNSSSSTSSSSKYSAGKGRTGNSKTDWSQPGKYNKGGLMKKKKK